MKMFQIKIQISSELEFKSLNALYYSKTPLSYEHTIFSFMILLVFLICGMFMWYIANTVTMLYDWSNRPF